MAGVEWVDAGGLRALHHPDKETVWADKFYTELRLLFAAAMLYDDQVASRHTIAAPTATMWYLSANIGRPTTEPILLNCAELERQRLKPAPLPTAPHHALLPTFMDYEPNNYVNCLVFSVEITQRVHTNVHTRFLVIFLFYSTNTTYSKLGWKHYFFCLENSTFTIFSPGSE